VSRPPRIYPQDVVDFVCDMYSDGATREEVEAATPKGYRVRTILERYLPGLRSHTDSARRGPASPCWLDRPDYYAAHKRITRSKGRAATHTCIDCEGPAAEWSYVHACPEEIFDLKLGAYCLHLDHYVARCRSCHRVYDRKQWEVGM